MTDPRGVEGIELALLRRQLRFRLNAGMPADLTKATPEQRERYEELLEAAQGTGEAASRARSELGGRKRKLESLANV